MKDKKPKNSKIKKISDNNNIIFLSNEKRKLIETLDKIKNSIEKDEFESFLFNFSSIDKETGNGSGYFHVNNLSHSEVYMTLHLLAEDVLDDFRVECSDES
jgi:regulatory protein YycH of two-component signal transduction system YycFG